MRRVARCIERWDGDGSSVRLIDHPWRHHWLNGRVHEFLVGVLTFPGFRVFVVLTHTQRALQTSLCMYVVGHKPHRSEIRGAMQHLDGILRHVCRVAAHMSTHDQGSRRSFRRLVAPLGLSGCQAGRCPPTDAAPVHVRCRAVSTGGIGDTSSVAREKNNALPQ